MSLETPLLDEVAIRISAELGNTFTPATAVTDKDIFCGRMTQVGQVCDAINQVGLHTIVYGERGVGKTSLAKFLAGNLSAPGRTLIAPHVNCDSGDDFASVWRKVLSEIYITNTDDGMGLRPAKKTSRTPLSVHVTDITPHTICDVFRQLGENSLIYVILDEFDKLPSGSSRALMADTLKALSDKAIPMTLILVGVANDVADLIADHNSIERCLSQIKLPRMSRPELEEIVTTGLNKHQMRIDPIALAKISGLSKGLPHYTHLLALSSGRQALRERSVGITPKHVKDAVSLAIRQIQESIAQSYEKATFSTKPTALYRQALLACAMAPPNDFGQFSPNDVADMMSRVMNTPYRNDQIAPHLAAFCSGDRGPVLRKSGAEYRWRYHFINPLMQPFILMKGLAEGLVNESSLSLDVDSSGQRILFPNCD